MSKLFLCLILILPLVVAIEITEVELNPPGKDTGNEWIEIYSKEQINLSNYIFKNNDGDELTINDSFKDYFIYYFPSQWLDNKDEKIFVYFESTLIQETKLFEDTENDEKNWQLCQEEWFFQEQTKNKTNCQEKLPEKIVEIENSTKEQGDIQNEEKENFFERREEFLSNFSQNKKNSTKKTINLNPKTIKIEEDNQTIREKDYAKYPIIVFCILLISLYLIKPKKKKNEWQ
jgi:hypothetical protein